MKRLLAFVFITLFTDPAIRFSVIASTDCAKDIESHSPTLRLRRHLFCDYDKAVRPSIHQNNATVVNLRLMPKFIEFDDHSNTLVIHAWMSMYWVDVNLKWTKDSFDAIDAIHVYSDEVWSPDISVYNSGDMGYEQSGVPRTSCILMSNGMTMCVLPVKYVTRCVADFKHWPFDRQNCTIRLGSWAHTGEEIDFHLTGHGIEMMDYTPNREWKVLSANASKNVQKFKCCPEDSFPSVFFNLVLERYSEEMQATVIAPALLLITITMTTLWLNPTSTERMVLACFNLVCHLMVVQELYWELPWNGDAAPSIMIFHRNSMIIAGLVMLLTATLRQLKGMSIPAPIWLTSTATAILDTKAGQFILLASLDPKASASLDAEEDNAGLVQPSSPSAKINPGGPDAWHHFATLVDRLSVVAVLFTYAIMIIVLLPKNDLNNVPNLSRF
ncbi:neuronal acetylcholine receptor subunit alpha-5-like [Athalia rosae]|uniref:neuronal acetylcholine receptor subunit alpha-5-like n=1 Tax=Athalia rosae TaxID=37344 RepID=UPI0020338497|nr:neuronal acetylcholine receptor subunit alpha-5-like [Athalia rosae]